MFDAWGTRGTVVFWAKQFVGVPSCPSLPHPAASPCAAPPRLARGMSGFWIRQVCLYIYIHIDLPSSYHYIPLNTYSKHLFKALGMDLTTVPLYEIIIIDPINKCARRRPSDCVAPGPPTVWHVGPENATCDA